MKARCVNNSIVGHTLHRQPIKTLRLIMAGLCPPWQVAADDPMTICRTASDLHHIQTQLQTCDQQPVCKITNLWSLEQAGALLATVRSLSVKQKNACSQWMRVQTATSRQSRQLLNTACKLVCSMYQQLDSGWLRCGHQHTWSGERAASLCMFSTFRRTVELELIRLRSSSSRTGDLPLQPAFCHVLHHS